MPSTRSSSSSRPSKRRALEEAKTIPNSSSNADPTSTAVVAVSTTAGTTSSCSQSQLPAFFWEQQWASIKAELEHERSMRMIDRQRAEAAAERQERQAKWLQQEARQATEALKQLQTDSDEIQDRLRKARDAALAQLRQREIDDHNLREEKSMDDVDMTNMWKEKCRMLEERIQGHQRQEKEFTQRLADLRSDFHRLQKQNQETEHRLQQHSSSRNTARTPVVIEEDSREELNRVRVALADAECRERQGQRRMEEMKQRHSRLLQEHEQSKLAAQRTPFLQDQVKELTHEVETLAAHNLVWDELAKNLEKLLPTTSQPSASDTAGSKSSVQGPPEISSVIRHLEKTVKESRELTQERDRLQEQCREAQTAVVPLEQKLQEAAQNERNWQREKRESERELQNVQNQLAQSQAQATIYKKESESLRELIKTVDDEPMREKSTGKGKSPSQSVKTLELSLESTKQELALSQKERQERTKEADSLHQELERVKEKFAKLRDALHAERAKASQADERAQRAEALAGKGAFNPETTRVLHIQETPLTEALREEVKVLKRQLEVANASNAGKQRLAPDPEKLNQRLKENFKEAISTFREGVYLMTGYKVDMLPGTDRPTFRVRSVYGEQEEDHLILKWPKSGEVTSLDILNTDFAKSLSTTPSYQYMTKFHSLPAFMASVQLGLFEKQTVMG